MDYDKRESMRLEQNAIFSDVYVAMEDAYYLHHPTGGPLHIVTDDQNVEDDHLKFCRRYAEAEGDIAGLTLLDMLEKLDPEQRYGVIKQVHLGWATGTEKERRLSREAVNFQCWRCRAHCPQPGPFKMFSDMITCAKCGVTSRMHNKELI